MKNLAKAFRDEAFADIGINSEYVMEDAMNFRVFVIWA
jgi:hypothetical protein